MRTKACQWWRQNLPELPNTVTEFWFFFIKCWNEKNPHKDYEWSLIWPETRSEGWPLGRCRASQTTSRHPAASHSPWEANSWNFQQNWSEIGEFSLLCTASLCKLTMLSVPGGLSGWPRWPCQCSARRRGRQLGCKEIFKIELNDIHPVSPDYKKQRSGQKLSEKSSTQRFLQEKFYDKSSKVSNICSTMVDTNNCVKLQNVRP